jgi:hypothetical protein
MPPFLIIHFNIIPRSTSRKACLRGNFNKVRKKDPEKDELIILKGYGYRRTFLWLRSMYFDEEKPE